MPKKIRYRYADAEEINKNLSIVQVALDWGLDLHRKGKRYFMLCPNPKHHDRHLGSCYLTDRDGRNLFYCWACGIHGGPIDLIMLIDSCDFVTARDKLAERYGFFKEKLLDPAEIWNGLSTQEYEEFGLHNVQIRLPYGIDENGNVLERRQSYTLRMLAKEDPEIHDMLLLSKFAEKIENLSLFMHMINSGELQKKYGPEFEPSKSWEDAYKECVNRLKRLLEKGLMDKSILDGLFDQSFGGYLLEKAQKTAAEILRQKRLQKNKAAI